MKNLFNLSLATLLTVAMAAACDSDSSADYHELSVPMSLSYADQTADTINIYSTDKWTLAAESDWLTPEFTTYDAARAAGISGRVPVSMDINDSGNSRRCYVTVKAGGRTLHQSKIQVYWLNILRPALKMPSGVGNWTRGDGLDKARPTFADSTSASAATDTIKFVLYDHRATLTTSQPWISLGQTNVENAVGTSPLKRIAYSVAQNTSGQRRTATITIQTSNGISTPITIIQGAN